MDDEIMSDLGKMAMGPITDLIQVRVFQVTCNRLARRRISFADSFFALWAIRIVAREVTTGVRGAMIEYEGIKKAAERLAKNLEQRQRERSGGPKKIFLG